MTEHNRQIIDSYWAIFSARITNSCCINCLYIRTFMLKYSFHGPVVLPELSKWSRLRSVQHQPQTLHREIWTIKTWDLSPQAIHWYCGNENQMQNWSWSWNREVKDVSAPLSEQTILKVQLWFIHDPSKKKNPRPTQLDGWERSRLCRQGFLILTSPPQRARSWKASPGTKKTSLNVHCSTTFCDKDD